MYGDSMTDNPTLLKVTSGEWTALFDVGADKLLVVGDSYLADEKIDSIFGVREIYSDAFLDRDGHCVVSNYSEFVERGEERERGIDSAAEKRAEAKRLLEEAEDLEDRLR